MFIARGSGLDRRVARFSGPALRERAACPGLVYSRYGNGRSTPLRAEERPVSYMHDEALQTLPAFLDCCRLAIHSVILFGHSDGASIAICPRPTGPNASRRRARSAPRLRRRPVGPQHCAIRATYEERRSAPAIRPLSRRPRQDVLWVERFLAVARVRRVEYRGSGRTDSFPALVIQGRDDVIWDARPGRLDRPAACGHRCVVACELRSRAAPRTERLVCETAAGWIGERCLITGMAEPEAAADAARPHRSRTAR